MPGFVVPPAASPHRRPRGAHHGRGRVPSYAGLRYNAKTCARPEPRDTRTWDKPPALPHPWSRAAYPLRCRGFFPSVLGVGVLLYSTTACCHGDSSFSTARLGLPTAPAVCLRALLPPSWNCSPGTRTPFGSHSLSSRGLAQQERTPLLSFLFVRTPAYCGCLPGGSLHVGETRKTRGSGISSEARAQKHAPIC